ncbi:MAG: DUF2231 domain-containing protein [Luteimonas sp.]
MDATVEPTHPSALHPAHALLMMAALPLFVGTLLCDIGYARSYQIQWANFASWLLAGGLFIAAFALIWAIAELFRSRRRQGRGLVYLVLLLATWGTGFINMLVHARDAWASMPTAVVLSLIVTVLAGMATGVAISGLCHTCHLAGRTP